MNVWQSSYENRGTSGRTSPIGRRGLAAALLIALIALHLITAPHASADPTEAGTFGGDGSEAGQLQRPGGIAVSPDGSRLFVADSVNQRIDEYTSGGEFVRAWGRGVVDGASKFETCTEETQCLQGQAGPNPAQLNEPIGVAVSPDGATLYALNRAKGDGRVLKFGIAGEVTYEGALPAHYGTDGGGKAGFSYPLPEADIAVGTDGTVYVADENRQSGERRVVAFDPATETFKPLPIGLENITAIATGPSNRLYACGGYGEIIVFEGGVEKEKIETYRSEITAIAVDPTTGDLFTAPKDYEVAEGISILNLRKISPSGEVLARFPVERVQSEEDRFPIGIAFDAGAELSGYEPGAIYLVNRDNQQKSESHVHVLAEKTPSKPEIAFEQTFANPLGTTDEDLSFTVITNGSDTHYYVEYGTTPGYGSLFPLPPGIDVGGGFEYRRTGVHLTGLQPDTTYHLAVVATNASGTTVSSDRTFTTIAPAGPFSLPNGRVWEQVTTGKGTSAITVAGIGANSIGEASVDGGAVSFQTSYTLPGSPAAPLTSSYVAFREPDGWHTYSATPPVAARGGSVLLPNPTQLLSRDLTLSIAGTERDLTATAPPGENLYLRADKTGAETLVAPGGASLSGASSDFSRIFFLSAKQLTADTPEGSSYSLYEYSGGALTNIGVLPGANAPTAGEVSTPPLIKHPISENGSRVFFLTEPPSSTPGGPTSRQLYERVDRVRTVPVSASQAKVADSEGAQQSANFVDASTDGRFAFFTSSARLTDDANTGLNPETGEPKDQAPNLYRYDLETGTLLDLSVVTEPADAEQGAAVEGAIASADGATAYFVAKGNLAPGAVSGQPNLYRWTQAGGVSLLATPDYESLSAELARTTADGSVLLFNSTTALDPAFPGVESRQIYRYSAAGGSIACVSCVRAGEQGTAGVEAGSGYGTNYLSADGSQVFFQTTSPLVPNDTNGRQDVYEWEGGRQYLLSSGTSPEPSSLIDADPSGEDVFFTTTDRLVPGDQDNLADVYDARIGGGLSGPPEPAAPCDGEGCLPAARRPFSSAGAGSSSFNGPANPRHKHHIKKHRRSHRRHVRRRNARHKKQQHNSKGSHAHAAVGKRG